MRKLTLILMIAGLVGFMACGGPSAEEKAAAEKAKLDSIANAAAEAAEAAILDSIAMAAEEAAEQAKLDSLEQALDAEKNKKAAPAPAAKPKASAAKKQAAEKAVEEAPKATPTRGGATKRGG